MSLYLSSWTALAKRAGGADRLSQYSGGDTSEAHPNVDEVIYRASDMFRAAALQIYTPESIDALTAGNATYAVLETIEALALHLLTIGDDIQPENHRYAYERAVQFLNQVRKHEIVIDGLTPLGAPSGSGRVASSNPTRVLDTDNPQYAARFGRI
jgi:hypothetical protein